MTKAIQNSITLVSSEVTFDPQLGYGTREVWRGMRNGILTKADAYILAGWNTTYRNDGGIWEMEAFIQAQPETENPTDEIPVDRYEIDSELAQVDMWRSHQLFEAAYADIDAPKSTAKAYDYAAVTRRSVEYLMTADTATGGPVKPTDSQATALLGSGTLRQQLYMAYLRGETNFEYRRPTLLRVRTYSASYTAPFIVPPWETVYSTAKLVSVFAIPTVVANRLPGYLSSNPTPTNNDDTVYWGWKQRRWTSDFMLATNKVEEVSEWVFDRWALAFYSFDT